MTSIATEDSNLAAPIITRRTTNGIVAETPRATMKNNRYKDDYLPSVLTNIRKNEKSSATKDQESHQAHSHDMHKDIIEQNHISCLYRAIKNSTNINEEDEQNLTALMVAIQQPNSRLKVRLLLYLGSSISYKNSKGNNAFDVAVEEGNEDMKKILWERMVKNNEHHDIFMQLCCKGNEEGVKWCLDNVSNENKRRSMIEHNENKEQEFPLLKAMVSLENPGGTCLLLIEEHKKLNPNFLTTCEATDYNVLMMASQWGELPIVKEVLNIYNAEALQLKERANGMNALMLASYMGHYDCVEFLVENYKEAGLLHEKDKTGDNALKCAENNQHENVVTLLKDYYD